MKAARCTSCSRPPEPGKSRCLVCKEKYDAIQKQRYETRKAAGICVACAKTAATSDSVYCAACLNKQRSRQLSWASRNATLRKREQVAETKRRQAAGVCTACESADVYAIGLCRICWVRKVVREHKMTFNAARQHVGLCCYCNEDAIGTRCDICKEKKKQTRQQRKAMGICVECNNPNDRLSGGRCQDCSDKLTARYHAAKAEGLCPECSENPSPPGGVFCHSCIMTKRTKSKRHRNKLRLEVLAAYGGVCACCGEATQDFLQVDHVYDNGAAHRKQMIQERKQNGGQTARLYGWLKRHGFPKDGFQLLCANCNFAKAKYGRCPHQR